MSASSLTVKEGKLRVLFAFEIGRGVDVEAASKRVREVGTASVTQMKAKRGSPYFGFDPPPLLVQQVTSADFPFKAHRAERLVELRIWPFGVVSVEYTITITAGTSWTDVTEVRRLVSEQPQLELDARTRVTELVKTLGDSVSQPLIADVVEDYVIAQIDAFEGEMTAGQFVKEHREAITSFLRQEDPGDVPSRDVIRDVMKGRFSWTTGDVTVIDWDGAIVFGADNDDICKLLELVQVQLLELKHLENLLTSKANTVYDHVTKALNRYSIVRGASNLRRMQIGLGTRVHDAVELVTLGLLLRDPLEETGAELEQLELDVGQAYSTVANAVNLLGHATLHRIYRIATNRCHFGELRKGIEQELEKLSGLLDRIESRKKTKEGHRMEFTVILLIVVEIILHVTGH